MTLTKPLSVAIITTSRADFGHVVWPLKNMRDHELLKPTLIVMGAHLSPEFGRTIDDIRAHGIEVDESIESLMSSDSDVGMAKTIGVSILGLSDVLSRLRPDVLLVTADRYEMLAAAAVALALRIPMAHVEGGEISQGAIDDAVRNALTKLSHLHFVPHQAAAQRVLALGEEPWRVCQSGAPSLDHLRHRKLMTKKALEKQLGLTLQPNVILISYHPVTLDADTTSEASEFYLALKAIGGQQLFCFPNCDSGSRKLIKMTEAYCQQNDSAYLFTNLDHWLYWNVLHHVRVMLGNSSSALMEAPSIPLPAINIGRRQQGRLMAANVIDCEASSEAIQTAYRRASSPEFLTSIKNLQNPYGDGFAASRMCDFLLLHTNRDKLLNKQAGQVIDKNSRLSFRHKS